MRATQIKASHLQKRAPRGRISIKPLLNTLFKTPREFIPTREYFSANFQTAEKFYSDHHASNASWATKSKMAYRDEIDDAFDAVVFLEERCLNIFLQDDLWLVQDCYLETKVESFMLEALVSDQLLLFQLLVAYKIAFSFVTSSSYDHFFQFLRWSLMRASTVCTKFMLRGF